MAGQKTTHEGKKAKILKLHKAGMNYTQISNTTNIERRKVANIIRDMDKEDRLRDLSSARRDVAGEYLKEHFKDLEAASFFLVGITTPDYWVIKLKSIPTDIESELIDYLKSSSFKPGAVQMYGMSRLAVPPYSDIESKLPETPTDDYYLMMQMVNPILAAKLAKGIMIGLQQHVPSLWPLIKQWEDKSKDYNNVLEEVLPRLRNIASELKIKPNQIDRAIKTAINVFWPEEYDDELSFPKIESQNKATDILLGRNQVIRQLKILRYPLSELGDINSKLLDVVNPGNLQKILIAGSCDYCPVF